MYSREVLLFSIKLSPNPDLLSESRVGFVIWVQWCRKILQLGRKILQSINIGLTRRGWGVLFAYRGCCCIFPSLRLCPLLL